MPKTKIIATLGPSSSSPTVLRKMMLSGMDVIRLNFSHGSHFQHLQRVKIVRSLNKKYRRDIKILIDLEGFRIRVGVMKTPIKLEKRQIVFLSSETCSFKNQKNFIPFDYEGSLEGVKKKDLIFIDDGNIVLKIREVKESKIKAEVMVGGVLLSRKGINIPTLRFEFKGLTSKDKEDLEFAFQHRPDFIAQSFVRYPEDVLALESYIREKLPECKIIAKIENSEGVKNIDRIIELSSGIMIARGDMGVCLPVQLVPFVQKMIIKKCNQKKKMVITATQMLESMKEHYLPTRAEVSDVANAILDGTGYLMLSAETATGKYPVEAVRMMNEIIKVTEKYKKAKRLIW